MVSVHATAGAESPVAVPATRGSPALAIDVPEGLGVAPGPAAVTFGDGARRTSTGTLPIRTSPKLPLRQVKGEHLPKHRVPYGFVAAADGLATLRDLPEVRAHPGAAIGCGFRLCTTGSLPADGPLHVVARFHVLPTPLIGPDVYAAREEPIRTLAPCKRQ